MQSSIIVSRTFTAAALVSSLFAATAHAGDGPAPVARSESSVAPIARAEIDGALKRGIQLLLEKQETLGAATRASEWPYEGVYRVDAHIPIGYRVGGTSIGALALLDVTRTTSTEAVDSALARALEFVLEALQDPRMARGFEGGYDVRGWGHAYALGFLLRMRALERVPTGHAKTVKLAIRELVDTLEKTAIEKRGGWNYARSKGVDDSAPSTFMTASTLQFLFEARAQGFDVSLKVVERALDALEEARFDTGAFQYATSPERRTGEGFEDVRGSTGRSPICETTLFLAGRGSRARIDAALDLFFEHWQWLEERRKQTGTHVKPYMIAPYYFFFAHRYAAQAIELASEDRRADYRARLYQLLWKVREESGGWNDRVFARSENFGTAMSMLALCEPDLERPSGWSVR